MVTLGNLIVSTHSIYVFGIIALSQVSLLADVPVVNEKRLIFLLKDGLITFICSRRTC